MNQHTAVKDWMLTFGQATPAKPGFPSDEVVTLRFDLILEELGELGDAMDAKDLTAVADALADLLYVVHGANVAFGLNGDAVFQLVHESNMAKLWTNAEVCSQAPEFWIDHNYRQIPEQQRYIVRRTDGKICKPPSWNKPAIAELLDAGTKQE